LILVVRSHYLLIQYQATIPITAYYASKTNTECGRVQTFGTLITGDARRIRVIESRIAVSNTGFNKKKTLFTSKLDLIVRKELVKSSI